MKMKPWIITGVSLLCAGAICCGAAVHAGALDQKRYMKMLDLTDYTDTPDGAFSSVLMDIESADVTVQNGSALSVAAKNVPEDSYSVTVENDTLHIQMSSNNEPWYSFTRFGFHPFSAPRAKITVTLPDAEYQAVAVANSAGDCTVSGISVSTLSLDLDYGDCWVQNVTAASLTAVNKAGEIMISDSSVSGTAFPGAELRRSHSQKHRGAESVQGEKRCRGHQSDRFFLRQQRNGTGIWRFETEKIHRNRQDQV